MEPNHRQPRSLKSIFCLIWISSSFAFGLSVFTKGFLLTRYEVSNHSLHKSIFQEQFLNGIKKLTDVELDFPKHVGRRNTFDRVIFIVIDGLRYDFVEKSNYDDNFYRNKMKFLQSLLENESDKSRVFKFIADPPTTTMQRLKGLTTGSLPTFVDASSNFASSEIAEDNLIYQLNSHNKTIVFMGDDTWLNLYPRNFKRKFPFPSFDVKDLDTVDNGIIDNLIPEMKRDDWNMIIAHFLGVDHCGHRYGPNHPEMQRKLTQMDSFLKDVVHNLESDTMLYVLGDHGMTMTGDHGGDSADEVTAGLFLYSKQTIFEKNSAQNTSNGFSVPQIDIVPTLALQLNVSIPFSNIGSIIGDLLRTTTIGNALQSKHDTNFALKDEGSVNLIFALYENALQVYKYLVEYSKVTNDIPKEKIRSLEQKFIDAEQNFFNIFKIKLNSYNKTDENPKTKVNKPDLLENQHQFEIFLRDVFQAYRDVWAKFNLFFMAIGIFLMTFAVIVSLYVRIQLNVAQMNEKEWILRPINLREFIGMLCSFLSWIMFANFLPLRIHNTTVSIVLHMISMLIFLSSLRPLKDFIDKSFWKSIDLRASLSIFVFFGYTFFLFSNSFIVQENSVLLALIQTLIITHFLITTSKKFSLVHALCDKPSTKKFSAKRLQQQEKVPRNSPEFQICAIILSVCLRISKIFWSCREEQSLCEGTNLLRRLDSLSHANGDVFFKYRLLLAILSILALIIPTYVWCKKKGNLASTSSVSFIVKTFLPVSGFCMLLHWSLQIPVKNKLVDFLDISWIQQVALPRVVFTLLLVSIVLLLWDPKSIYVVIRSKQTSWRSEMIADFDQNVQYLFKDLRESLSRKDTANCIEPNTESLQNDNPPLVFGIKDVYTSAYFGLLAPLALSIMLLLGDGLAFAVVLMLVSSICVLSISSNKLNNGNGPDAFKFIIWYMLSCYWFFATGHQTAIASIRFDAAFVGIQGVPSSRIFPAMLIFLNTFASNVFFALGLPMLFIWNNRRAKGQRTEDTSETGEMSLQEDLCNSTKCLMETILGYLTLAMYKVTVMACVASLHRRHLMVWKIFGPRFVFEAASLLVSMPFLLSGFVYFLRISNSLQKWTFELEELCKLS